MARNTYTDDTKVGQPSDIVLKDGTIASGGVALEAIDKPLNKDWMDDVAFMEEEIEIMLQESADANAENPVTVGNQGIFKQFYRGQPTKAKRKFVDCLIVKSSRVATPEFINGAGERARSIRQHNAHVYPFMVINDPNPRGAEWLRRRLSEVI